MEADVCMIMRCREKCKIISDKVNIEITIDI